MSDKQLSPFTSRELTDREVCKAIGGLLGGLATMAPGKTIYEALDFFQRHRDVHQQLYDATFQQAVASGTVIRATDAKGE